MNVFQVLAVNSSNVENPKRRLRISRKDVDDGLLSIRIFRSRHGRKPPTFHILKNGSILFTGRIQDTRTITRTCQIEYTLIGGELSGYQIFTTANVAVQKV